MRIQLPKMLSLGINNYGKLELETNENFIDMWRGIEEEYKRDAKFEWTPNPGEDGVFRVRIDESTQFFDSNSEYVCGTKETYQRQVTCIIDVLKTYNFKSKSGISCRVHQIKVHSAYLF
mgnify:CR=1 FL=1